MSDNWEGRNVSLEPLGLVNIFPFLQLFMLLLLPNLPPGHSLLVSRIIL